VVLDIAGWAVPFGIIGGRLYHVVTDPELYFLPGRDPWDALKIWQEWDGNFPGFRRVYAHDPFGNRLEFLQASP